MLSKVPTFILFKKVEGDITEMLPPCFEDQIEDNFKIFFQSDLTMERMEESLFATIYPEDYYSQKRIFWTDYLEILIESLIGIDITDLEINDDDNSVESDTFCIYENEEGLFLYFGVECDNLLSALLTLEISKYFEGVFDIDIRGIYYVTIDKDGSKRILTDETAYQQLLLDKTKTNLN